MSTATTARESAVLPRRRGQSHLESYTHGYSSYDDYVWRWNKHAPMLSSLLTNGFHAPVLDVDRPIVAEPLTDGTQVTIPGVRRWQAWRIADALNRAGFCHPYLEGDVRRLKKERWRRAHERVTLTLPFACDVEVLPSGTAGHHHVLVNEVMSWGRTQELVKILSGPVVDRKWARANASSSIGLLIYRPLA